MRILQIILLLLISVVNAQDKIPTNALKYRSLLRQQGFLIWGSNAPISLMAAQIHQESGWRPNAKSEFASGLAQFTPDTANWINELDRELKSLRDVFNPKWAIRALVFYDKFLFDKLKGVNLRERYAFMLVGYNGGFGWVVRERRAAVKGKECDDVWFDGVEKFCVRSQAACVESREYPKKIFKLKEIYEGF